jgi:hypothetical protein
MPSVSAWPAMSTDSLRQETTPGDLPFVPPYDGDVGRAGVPAS